MGTVTPLKGMSITLTNNKAVVLLDCNDRTGRVVRVASPYPNHNTMRGRSYVEVLSSLLSSGWKEIERREWSDVYM